MRRAFSYFAAAGLSLVVLVSQAQAEWPNLNPFKQASTTQKKSSSSNSNASTWMPSLPTPPAPTETWNKVKTGTSNAYNKTKQTLAPLNPLNWKSAPTGKKTSANGSWIPNWMQPYSDDTQGTPQTVHDWISGERPS